MRPINPSKRLNTVIVCTCLIGCGGSDNSKTEIQCGPKTRLEGSQCVVDELLLLPQVTSVRLVNLAVEQEGEHPFHPMHALRARINLEITGEAFKTSGVLGLESTDGKKRCLAGYWPIDFQPGTGLAAAGAAGSTGAAMHTNPELMEFVHEFYVQPDCERLVGETGVRVWVSFDPFGNVHLPSRTLVEPPQTSEPEMDVLLDYMQQSRLSAEHCAAGQGSSHPDTCDTDLEIQASPGRDVHLEDVELSTAVAIVEVGEPGSGAPAGKVNAPHFNVSSTTLVYGLNATEAQSVSSKDVKLEFAIRAKALDGDRQQDEGEWVPLYGLPEQPEEDTSTTDEPVVSEDNGSSLEAGLVDSMVGASRVVKDAPAFISRETEALIATGKWMHHDLFDLRACAMPTFGEGGIGDAAQNNCRILPVVILRKQLPEDSSIDKNPLGGALKGSIEKGASPSWGDPSQIALGAEAKFRTDFYDDAVYNRAWAGTYLKGWFPFTILEIGAELRDRFAPAPADCCSESPANLNQCDQFEYWVTAFGARHPTVHPVGSYWEKTVGIGEAGSTRGVLGDALTMASMLKKAKLGAPTKEQSQPGPLNPSGYSPPASGVFRTEKCKVMWETSLPIEVCAGLSLYLGLGLGASREDMTSGDYANYSAACNSGANVNGTCYLANSGTTESQLTFDDASSWCQKHYGFLAAAESEQSKAAIASMLKRLGLPNAWLGIQRKLVPPNAAAPGAAENWEYVGYRAADTIAQSTLPFPTPPVGSDARGVLIGDAGTLDTAPKGENHPFICEYLPGSALALNLTPYATAQFNARAGVTFVAVKGGIWLDVDVLTLMFPVQVGMRYWASTAEKRLYSQWYVDQNLIPKTLKGALGGYFSWWSWWKGWRTLNYTFYGWPGLESDPYRLWYLPISPPTYIVAAP